MEKNFTYSCSLYVQTKSEVELIDTKSYGIGLSLIPSNLSLNDESKIQADFPSFSQFQLLLGRQAVFMSYVIISVGGWVLFPYLIKDSRQLLYWKLFITLILVQSFYNYFQVIRKYINKAERVSQFYDNSHKGILHFGLPTLNTTR